MSDHPLPPNRRLRVLCYIGSLSPGGAERQVLQILRHLDRTRFTPVLALAMRQGELLAEIPDDVPVVACQEMDAGVPWNHRFGLGRWTRWRWLTQVIQRQDIDVVYDRTYLATLDAAPATGWCRVPRISAAVADPQIQFAMYARRPKWLWRRLSQWAYQSATMVLANSTGLRQQLIDFWSLPPDHVRVLPNAYDFAQIDELAATPLPASTDQRFRLLTVGRIDEDKGHADLLAALDQLIKQRNLQSLRWQIIGTGPSAAALRQNVIERGLQDHVEFLGVVTNPFPYYRAADLFCLPSRTEGLPNVLIEALACGTPVIAADCPSGPREILAEGRYGALVPVRDSRAIAESIARHLQQPSRLQTAAIAGRDAVRETYSADKVIRALEALILSAFATKLRR